LGVSVRPWLQSPDGIEVTYDESPPNLGSGEESKAVIYVSPAHFEALVARCPYATAMLGWYRDLLDRQWLATSDVVLGWIGPVDDGRLSR
jgi:hypothetical protein